MDESEITIQEEVKEVNLAVKITQPVFKVTFAECVCQKSKVAFEPQPTLTESNECSAIDTGFVVAIPKAIEWKQPNVSLPNELDDEHELNGCQLWGNNWRQFTSILPGILLLFTIGLHHVFTVYELDYFTTDHPGHLKGTFADRSAFDAIETSDSRSDIYGSNAAPGNNSDIQSTMKNPKSTAVVMMWYLGAILGGLFGAVLVRNMKKRSIYVGCRCVRFLVTIFNTFFLFLVSRI